MSENTQTSAPAASEAVSESQASEVIEQSNEGAVENQEQSAGGDKTPAEAKKEEAKIAKKIKQLKLKIDGKESVEDLPFEVDEGSEAAEYMTKQLQLAKAAQKRMGEASEYKKKLDQVGEYLQQAKGNPKKIRELMRDLEIDERQLAALIVEEELEKAKKSPEQLEKEALQAELQKIKEERDNEKKALEKREYDRLVEQETQRYSLMIDGALQNAGLPNNQVYRERVAKYLSKAIDKGMEVSAEDVLPMVKEEIAAEIQSLFASSPEDYVEQLLGKDTLKRLRKRNLEKAKAGEPPVPLKQQLQDTGSEKSKPKEEPKVSFKDYFRKL
jgi:hypothetical protein